MDSDSIYWPDTLPSPGVDPKFLNSPRTEPTQFDSGRTRTRRQAEDLWEIIEVQWNFVEDQFATFRTFFEETLEQGSLPFVIEIFGVDTEVQFQEPEYTLNHSDNLFEVTGKLCIV